MAAEWQMRNYDFENNFQIDSWVEWVDKNWTSFVLPTVTLYIILVFTGRSWMSPLEPFKLRKPLLLWNILLAGFSIFGSIRDAPVMMNIVSRDGLHASICDSKYFDAKYRSFWTLVFVVSKIPELVDTFFIVLRKQKLIFLHWYHHASVAVFAFYMFSGKAPVSRWFVTMNFIVHSVMYSYYAFRAGGMKPPTFIPMCITTLQIMQMIMGTYFVTYALGVKLNGGTCAISNGRIAFGMLMYISYGVLFTYFFYASYMKPKPSPEEVMNGRWTKKGA